MTEPDGPSIDGFASFERPMDDLGSPSIILPLPRESPSPPSPSLSQLERAELVKLREEVAQLRSQLGSNGAKESRNSLEETAASGKGVWSGLEETASQLRADRLSDCATSPGSRCQSLSETSVKASRCDWVLRERAYCWARDFFLDQQVTRTRGELLAAVQKNAEIVEYFLKHFAPLLAGDPNRWVTWDEFVDCYVDHCKHCPPSLRDSQLEPSNHRPSTLPRSSHSFISASAQDAESPVLWAFGFCRFTKSVWLKARVKAVSRILRGFAADLLVIRR
ncbi:unnamed protein product [Effrenium voratum]|uniref:Uncharacterized protein n=1 Tax=Effrenium voratum TaxID=2562239 RepID=A0AA36MWH1_9DINO|nr:unnamed protein product [Effrenium voratum]